MGECVVDFLCMVKKVFSDYPRKVEQAKCTSQIAWFINKVEDRLQEDFSREDYIALNRKPLVSVITSEGQS